MLLITDQRLVFATPDGTVPKDASLRYSNLATADIRRGRVSTVVVESVDSVRWTFPLPNTDAATIDAIGGHLRWIERVRTEFFEVKNDIELAAGAIREAAESMDWDDAFSRYRDVRTTLDQFICTLELTEPVANEVLAPELTEIERTLEKAHVTLYIERARSELELGTYLIEHEDSDRPKEVLQRALRFYDYATGQQDAVERGDAFEFGTQRTLKREIEKLGWEIEMVAAEPRRQAEEAKLNAQAAKQVPDAIEHWEAALRRYEQALVLELGDHTRQFTGDPKELQNERNIAVDMLHDLHYEYAQTQWSEGIAKQQTGDVKAAIAACETAVSHLERIDELSTEYDISIPSDIESRLSKMKEVVVALRTGEAGSGPDTTNSSDSPTKSNSPETTPSESPSPTDGMSDTSTPDNRRAVTSGEELSHECSDDSILWRSGAADQSTAEAIERTTTHSESLDIPTLDEINSLDTHSDITFTLADPKTDENDPAGTATADIGTELKPPDPADETDESSEPSATERTETAAEEITKVLTDGNKLGELTRQSLNRND